MTRAYAQVGGIGATQAVYANKTEWEKRIAGWLLPMIAFFGTHASGEIAQDTGRQLTAFKPQAQPVPDWIRQTANQQVAQISKTTSKRITDFLDTAQAQGMKPEDIGAGLRDIYQQWQTVPEGQTSRARMIAETASGQAVNWGRHEAAKQESAANGQALNKTWVTMHDERVRPSHAELDNETQSMDDPFSNGLQYPGDPTGDPDEVINCRCVLNYSPA